VTGLSLCLLIRQLIKWPYLVDPVMLAPSRL